MHMRLRQLLQDRVPARSAWRDARGWTLLELVIVMALIVLLAGIATAQHRNAVTRTKEAVLKENLFRMRDAIDRYYADKNRYPSDLQALVSDQYIREVPVDPFTQSNSTWETVPRKPIPRIQASRSASITSRAAPRVRRSTAPPCRLVSQTGRIVRAHAASIASIAGSRHSSGAGTRLPAGGASSSTSRRCSHVVSCHFPNLNPMRG